MNIKIENTEKKIYSLPQIERIKLDNEISLVLASDLEPDGEPNWTSSSEYFKNDPFKGYLG